MVKSKYEKQKFWEYSISLNQIDGEYIPSDELKQLIEKEINGEIKTDEIIKKLIEKYKET